MCRFSHTPFFVRIIIKRPYIASKSGKGETQCEICSEARFLFSCEPLRPDNLQASNMQYWNSPKTDIPIPKGRQKREGRGSRSLVTSKPSRITRSRGWSIILFDSMVCFPGPLCAGWGLGGGVCPLHSAGLQAAPLPWLWEVSLGAEDVWLVKSEVKVPFSETEEAALTISELPWGPFFRLLEGLHTRLQPDSSVALPCKIQEVLTCLFLHCLPSPSSSGQTGSFPAGVAD